MAKIRRNWQAVNHFDAWHLCIIPWGVTGDPAKDYAGGYGLSHILVKHGEADLKMLPHALARGEITQNATEPAKKDVTWGRYLAVLVKENSRGAWTLSAYTRR